MLGKLIGLRGLADEIYREALRAADPEEAVYRHFRVKDGVLRVGDVDYFLSQFQRVFLIGAGKASVRMGQAVERVIGPKLEGGLVITGRGQAGQLRKVLVREASHPLPDEDGARATEEMIELVSSLSDQDLVICALSGGGSALLTAPVDGVSVTDLQRLNKLLLFSGLPIGDVNIVRKSVSKIKGGRLAQIIHPATIITLILSDVIGDRLDIIASGPTCPDQTSIGQAMATLKNRGIWDQAPASVRQVLEHEELAPSGAINSEVFGRVHHQIVGSNRISLVAAEKRARRRGMNTILLASSVAGESREIARFYGAIAREIREHQNPVKPPACIIAGGETTVTVTGKGRGGRCQELCLAVAREIEGLAGTVFLAAGTDGIDGATDAAGAVADNTSMDHARRLGLDPEALLNNNDAYAFFGPLDDLVMTGPTGTNVMDVHILVVG